MLKTINERFDIMSRITKTFWFFFVALLVFALTGCGGSNSRVTVVGPGLVGIDDRPATATPPILIVDYTLPGDPFTVLTASIISDQPVNGDIAYDPIFGSYTITQGPETLLFGFDSRDPNFSEYRAFMDFPLDGSTGQAAIPLDAVIEQATLTIFIDFVEFNIRVPVLLDLVSFDISGLVPADFDAPFFASTAFDLLVTDTARDVTIDVTGLMDEAQFQGLDDFQVRFLLGP
ncbi:MAG: hypothetical protein C0623_02615 [Desulfuromonas sp.]|nr:MAG: hypothetical protein C0623_02615 [Desulfuromonas sp.]